MTGLVANTWENLRELYIAFLSTLVPYIQNEEVELSTDS